MVRFAVPYGRELWQYSILHPYFQPMIPPQLQREANPTPQQRQNDPRSPQRPPRPWSRVRCAQSLGEWVFVTAVVLGAIVPYYPARWLIQHEAVYYELMDSGRFGRFLTGAAECIYFISPVPFAFLGFCIGITLVDIEKLPRRPESRDVKPPAAPNVSTSPTPGVTAD